MKKNHFFHIENFALSIIYILIFFGFLTNNGSILQISDLDPNNGFWYEIQPINSSFFLQIHNNPNIMRNS